MLGEREAVLLQDLVQPPIEEMGSPASADPPPPSATASVAIAACVAPFAIKHRADDLHFHEAGWAKGSRRPVFDTRMIDCRNRIKSHCAGAEIAAAVSRFAASKELALGVKKSAGRLQAAVRRCLMPIAKRTYRGCKFSWPESFLMDLRYAFRAIVRRPLYAAVAIFSLAVALGANTAVFSFVNAIVLKRLPVLGGTRLVLIRQQNQQFNIENCCFPYAFFRELRNEETDFEDVLALHVVEIKLTDQEQTERLGAEIVSGNYFRMLGVQAAAGRLLDDSDDQSEGANPVCVISHSLWQERFGGRHDVIGRRVLLNTEPFQIVGVSESGFFGASLHERHELQIPTSMTERILKEKRDAFGFLHLIGRLKVGVRAEQAQTRLNVVGRQIQRVTGPRMTEHDDFLLRDGSQGIDSRKENFGKPLMLLLLLVVIVLLVACANLAALLLARSVERTREAGLRVALGASRSALLRQFFAESAVLAAAGGVAGWILALTFIQVLLHILGSQGEGLVQLVKPDGTVFAFLALATVSTGVLVAVLPARRAAQADPSLAIRGAAFTSPERRSLTLRFIIMGQMALSLTLLFCAGLFVQTLQNLRSVNLGFPPGNLVILPVDLSSTAYSEGAASFFTEILHRTSELHEIRSASLAGLSVISGRIQSTVITVPSYATAEGLQPVTYFTRISSGYFRTLGIPLLAGRDFVTSEGSISADSSENEGTAIVNEQFARRYFDGDALGKTFSYGGGRKVRIVGIAQTTKFRYIREEPQPVMYLPIAPENFPASLFLQVRSSMEPTFIIERLRQVVDEVVPGIPIGRITTMKMQIDAALSRERLLAFLSILLGGIAATLAAIGLYGVLSFAVVRRTREIGVRMAVGANRSRILMLFLADSAWIVLFGFAAGTPLAIGCGVLASSLLYGLDGQDTSSALAAAAILGLISIAAALLPAARATRVDPMRALRHD